MSFQGNRMYNDPYMGQIASNLQRLVGGPTGAESGSDAAGYATADAKRAEMNRLGRYFDMSMDPNVSLDMLSRVGIGAGQLNFTNSKYGVDQGNINNLEQRRLMEQGLMDREMIKPITVGKDQQVYVSPKQAEIMDIPTLLQGKDSPLTADQLAAQQRQQLIEAGVITQDMLLDDYLGQRTPVQGVGPDGKTGKFLSPGAAVRTGAQPVINKGAEASAKLLNYQTPDGRSGSALFDPGSQTLVDATTRQPLPQGTRTYTGQLSGSQDETGLGLTGATQSRVQQQLLSTDQTLDTARTLRDLVSSSPSSQGLVGSLRGTAQDIVQTGGDLGQFFGGAIEEANQAVRAGMLDAGVAAQNFDPNIPAIQMMTNLLAWQYAKSLSGDRVSNEQLNQARVAIGGEGIFANRANTLTRLDQLIQSMERQRANLQPMAPGVGYGNGSAPANVVAPPGLSADDLKYLEQP